MIVVGWLESGAFPMAESAPAMSEEALMTLAAQAVVGQRAGAAAAAAVAALAFQHRAWVAAETQGACSSCLAAACQDEWVDQVAAAAGWEAFQDTPAASCRDNLGPSCEDDAQAALAFLESCFQASDLLASSFDAVVRRTGDHTFRDACLAASCLDEVHAWAYRLVPWAWHLGAFLPCGVPWRGSAVPEGRPRTGLFLSVAAETAAARMAVAVELDYFAAAVGCSTVVGTWVCQVP